LISSSVEPVSIVTGLAQRTATQKWRTDWRNLNTRFGRTIIIREVGFMC
jgi:hypothetical protein